MGGAGWSGGSPGRTAHGSAPDLRTLSARTWVSGTCDPSDSKESVTPSVTSGVGGPRGQRVGRAAPQPARGSRPGTCSGRCWAPGPRPHHRFAPRCSGPKVRRLPDSFRQLRHDFPQNGHWGFLLVPHEGADSSRGCCVPHGAGDRRFRFRGGPCAVQAEPREGRPVPASLMERLSEGAAPEAAGLLLPREAHMHGVRPAVGASSLLRRVPGTGRQL